MAVSWILRWSEFISVVAATKKAPSPTDNARW